MREGDVAGAPPRAVETSWKRKAKRAVLHVAKAAGVFALMHRLTRQRVRILCYHGVWRGEDGFSGDAMFMRRATFERRMEWLARSGMPVIPLSDAVAGLAGDKPLPDGSVVITIDDGWYSTYADMLPALSRHRMPATIYCDTAALERGIPIPHVMARYLMKVAPPANVTPAIERTFAAATDLTRDTADRLAAAKALAAELGLHADAYRAARVFAYMTPDELRAAAAEGFDIQLHTHNHTLGNHGVEKTRAEIDANRAALATLLGGDPARFCHFAFPSGVYEPSSIAALATCGVASSTTCDLGLAHRKSHGNCLPRITDGEQVSDIEFEAELSGFMDVVRSVLRPA